MDRLFLFLPFAKPVLYPPRDGHPRGSTSGYPGWVRIPGENVVRLSVVESVGASSFVLQLNLW